MARAIPRIAGTGSPSRTTCGAGAWTTAGFAVTEALRQAIMLVPEKVWTPAFDADGGVRAGGDVAELTGLLDLGMAGRGCGSSCAVNVPIPAPSCRYSRNVTAGGIRRSSPTPPPGSWRSWRPVTAPMPASRTASGTPKTLAWAGSRHASSRSITPG